MPMFLCRWPNGFLSVVSAPNKSDAVEFLDEFDNADRATITRMPECMVHFRLNDAGEVELEGLGVGTEEFIMQTCYPGLEEAMVNAERDDAGRRTANGTKQVRAAVRLERTRILEHKPRKSARTELGRHLQKEVDLPAVVADRMVRRTAKEILRSNKGDDGPVQ